MPEKFNPNSLLRFLKHMKRSESKGPPAAPTTIGILQLLASAPGAQMDVASLLAASDIPAETFANALRELEAAGLLVTRTENGRQVVVLNPMGEQVAHVKF